MAASNSKKRRNSNRPPTFEALSAIAIRTGPRLRPVDIPAAIAAVCILNAHQLEVLFPVGPFFRERRVAERTLQEFEVGQAF